VKGIVMTRLPRLLRQSPVGPVTQARPPVPVIALITWHDGHTTTEDAMALAWTHTEVLVEWTTPWGSPHQVWLCADHVQRATTSLDDWLPVDNEKPDHADQRTDRTDRDGRGRPDG
jgi:hypothetical protein